MSRPDILITEERFRQLTKVEEENARIRGERGREKLMWEKLNEIGCETIVIRTADGLIANCKVKQGFERYRIYKRVCHTKVTPITDKTSLLKNIFVRIYQYSGEEINGRPVFDEVLE